MLYGTTPGPTTISGSYAGGALVFPFNDDENFHNGGVINTREYLGDFARFMGARLPAGSHHHHRAVVDGGAAEDERDEHHRDRGEPDQHQCSRRVRARGGARTPHSG